MVGRSEAVAASAVLFHEGERIDGVCCLCAGSAVLTKWGEDATPHTISVAVPGDLLGCPDVMLGDFHRNSAIMLDAGRVAFLPREQILALIREDSALLVRLMGMLSRRIAEVEQRLGNLVPRAL